MSLPRDQRKHSYTEPLVLGKSHSYKHSTNDGHCHYLKPGFYQNVGNQFWERASAMVSESGKDYFRECLTSSK